MANPSPKCKTPPRAGQFQPGNPGRPKGSRNRLAETFFSALYNDFQRHGEAAIAGAREESPLGYLKVVASVIPQKVEIERTPEKVSDAELLEIIREGAFAEQVAQHPPPPPRPNVEAEGRA